MGKVLDIHGKPTEATKTEGEKEQGDKLISELENLDPKAVIYADVLVASDVDTTKAADGQFKAAVQQIINGLASLTEIVKNNPLLLEKPKAVSITVSTHNETSPLITSKSIVLNMKTRVIKKKDGEGAKEQNS